MKTADQGPTDPLALKPGELLNMMGGGGLETGLAQNKSLSSLYSRFWSAAKNDRTHLEEITANKEAFKQNIAGITELYTALRVGINYNMIGAEYAAFKSGAARAEFLHDNLGSLTNAFGNKAKTLVTTDIRQQITDCKTMFVMANSQMKTTPEYTSEKTAESFKAMAKIASQFEVEKDDFSEKAEAILSGLPIICESDEPTAHPSVVEHYIMTTQQMGALGNHLAELCARRAENGINCVVLGDCIFTDCDEILKGDWPERRQWEIVDAEIYIQRALLLEERSRNHNALGQLASAMLAPGPA